MSKQAIERSLNALKERAEERLKDPKPGDPGLQNVELNGLQMVRLSAEATFLGDDGMPFVPNDQDLSEAASRLGSMLFQKAHENGLIAFNIVDHGELGKTFQMSILFASAGVNETTLRADEDNPQ